jgi:outer membrane receptor protein involved in Fe transport
MTKHVRERLLASSMIGGFALVGLTATQAFAQDAAPPSAGVEVQELVVTGSRIPQPNLTSISPVQTVNAAEIAIGGRPATVDILSQLPQTTFNAGADLGPTNDALTTPGGVSTADLRGLGPQRTLVLIDGRRLGIGDPSTANPNPAPDINQIPSQLIDRVEILTGGASATYGSDAVAGVVNFIMKKNFEGVQLDAQFGVNQHSQHSDFMQGVLKGSGYPIPDSKWDGKSVDYSLIFGANAPDGRGNVTGYVTYHQQDPIYQSARDFSGCQLESDATCGGSANSNFFQSATGNQLDLNGDGIPDTDAGAVLGHSFVPWGTPGTTPPQFFNANPYETLIQQDTRYTAGFMANYEINKNFNVYTDFSYMNDQTHTQVGPSALFAGSGSQPSGGFLVNCSNPFLSSQQALAIGCTSPTDTADLLIGRRNVEGEPRKFDYEHDNYRIVLGTKGKLFGPFSYDLYGSYYYTSVFISNANFFSISKAQNALQVVTDPVTGQPVCMSGAAGCLPYNIFSDGGVTKAVADSLTGTGTSRGTTTERIIEGTVTGSLEDYGVKSPWSTDAVSVSLGFQSRRDHLTYAPDQAELSNDLSGFGGAAVVVNNGISVQEGFGEIQVPIVQDMPFVHDLTFNGGYRYSHYSTGINANTYKLGLEWAPTEDIRFRGGFNRAVRAPNLLELYTPQSVTNTSDVASDDCAGSSPVATLEQCQRTGVTAAQYGHIPQCPANQCATLTGGNLDLAPEKANTYTVGFLLTPKFIPGFTASLDYFHIKLNGIISNIPLAISYNNCLNTGDPTYCANVVRNPANGILFGTTVGAGGYIAGTNVNVASQLLTGLDLQAGYKWGLDTIGHDGWGSITFNMVGSYAGKNENVPLPGAEKYDCAGLFGLACGGLFPKWRHTLRVTWNAPHDVQLSGAWRYISHATFEEDTNEPTIGTGGHDPIGHSVPAVSYFDLAAAWNINEKLAVRGGINNIFDKNPPLLENSIVGGALPNTWNAYDLLGRHMFVSLTARF